MSANTDLQILHDFLEDMASKGYIQIGEYLKLKDILYRLEKQ